MHNQYTFNIYLYMFCEANDTDLLTPSHAPHLEMLSHLKINEAPYILMSFHLYNFLDLLRILFLRFFLMLHYNYVILIKDNRL